MANEEYQIPIFLINGQLDSGKTRFISDTIAMGQFAEAKNKLLIVCEEGEEEYSEKLLKDNGVDMVVLEKEELKDFSIVTFKHRIGNKDLGTIGIIGPKRMDYAKVISVMKYISKKLNNTDDSKDDIK